MIPGASRKTSQRGSTVLEFALATLLLIPLCFGVVGLGLTMGNYIAAIQATRDAAHMFARGIDFNTDANKDVIVRLSNSLSVTRSGGNGFVIFSKIVTPRDADCAAASITTGDCLNRNMAVVIHRTTVGNAALPSSASQYGTPSSSIVSSDGNIRASEYLRNLTVRAGGFGTELSVAGITQLSGDIAYVVEGYFTLPSLTFIGYTPGRMYCRFMF